MVWDRKRIEQMEKLPKSEYRITLFGRKIRVSVVQTYWLYYVSSSFKFMKGIWTWLYRWYSAKRRCLFSLFAGTVFQEWHCVPFPLRMCRYGKRGQLSLQGCKPPYSNYRIPVCFALSRIPLKLRSCKEPSALHEMSGRLLLTGRKVPIRSWRLR